MTTDIRTRVSLLARYAPLLAAGALIMGAVILCMFDSPSADDFYRASIRTADLLAYLNTSYHVHTGRWMELTLEVLCLSRTQLTRTYPLDLLSLLAVYAFALYAFFRAVFGGILSRPEQLGATATALALIIAGMPSIGQTIFWFSGAISSLLPFFCTLLLLAVLVSWSGRPATWRHGAATAVLALLIAGLHEMFALLLCMTLATGVMIMRATQLPGRRLWLWALSGAAVGTLIVVSAPGNSVRAADVSTGLPHVSVLKILENGVILFLRDVVSHWVLDLRLLAATVVFILHPAVQRLHPQWLRQGGRRVQLVVAAGWLLSIGVPLVATQLSMARLFELPGRTFDGLYCFFLLGWFTTVFVFSRGDSERDAPSSIGPAWAMVVLAGALLQSPNSLNIARDLTSKALPWRNALAARSLAIAHAQANHQLEVDVSSLAPLVPASFFYQDVIGTADNWRNRFVAQYYGLRQIKAH